MALWGAQVVQITADAWVWRWTLGPYVHAWLGPKGAHSTSWGIGLHADVRPEYGMAGYVAVNLVALGVVAALGAASTVLRPVVGTPA